MKWLDAVQKTKAVEDPWKQFDIESEPSERALRFRYNSLQKKWVQDTVEVKMQKDSFARGAMRMCFRMKKLSKIVHQNEWKHATNIVAKHYIQDVLPKTYIEDVRLQMDAKLWAEEYNRHCPPKQVDIMQVGCIKLIDRNDTPMYHIEHFVEGDYVKYNSNSGFVLHGQDDTVRETPQAFSHFTFERSGYRMMVVDVQGVGDLYTDPQIHSADSATEYGDGNLGTKGMALFFATHKCLNICHQLDLKPFDLSSKELERLKKESCSSSSTEVKPHDHQHSEDSEHHHKVLPNIQLVEQIKAKDACCPDNSCTACLLKYAEKDTFMQEQESRRRSDDSGISMSEELSADTGTEGRNLSQHESEATSILGQIHFDLATYNYVGRFTEGEPDHESCLYHLQEAATCGLMEANKILAWKFFNLSTEQFEDVTTGEDFDSAMDYLIQAASQGDCQCLLKAAQAFETGQNLGTNRKRSCTEALKYYERALNDPDLDLPLYEIHASIANIWRFGGYGVEKDACYAGELYTQAAEAAMACGKGKLSSKYFMIAEDAWGEVEGGWD